MKLSPYNTDGLRHRIVPRGACRSRSVVLQTRPDRPWRPVLGTTLSAAAVLWQVLAVSGLAADASGGGGVSPPAYRVETEGFEASEADIRAVLDSASRELWKFFPDYSSNPSL